MQENAARKADRSANSDNSPRSPAPRPQYQSASSTALPLTPSEDRQWATLAHFGGILGCIPSLVIYLIFKDRGPFTAQESKEALNFTLPLTVAAVIVNLLINIPAVNALFAVLAAAIWVFLTVYSVIAGIEVNRGRPYRYPLNLRLIR
ncbi:DUF4870 domain-containing protein [Arthrobacter sp. I2-34]|uniref:DUF4870 domain-containing protein n=1 Tax=Arthrobacter hankyongi TaxID=2904801 RepID=A0ABS9L6F0_9MICC|nr:DUF4870 domain-containing protein [Arthrobacter hankyongi]MCG2622234.1 DUF4870 domain-containing protein [Arthrobacter hankyongi]